MRKVMIVLGVLIVLVSTIIAGCGKSKEEGIVGKYVHNPKDSDLPRQIITIKEDGSYRLDIDYRNSDVADTTLTGRWEIIKGKIVLYGSLGIVQFSGEIKGNTLVDHLNNRIFVKQN